MWRHQWNRIHVLCLVVNWRRPVCTCAQTCSNPKCPSCTTMLLLSNTAPTRLIVVDCTPESLPCTMPLTEFQNKRAGVRQTECRFGTALRLNDFLTLMLQEIPGGALSHGASGPFSLRVEHVIGVHLAAAGPWSVTCCSSITRGLWETGSQ